MSAKSASPARPTLATSLHDSSLAVTLTVLAFLLALVLRLDGFRDDLWVDELHTAWVVDGSWNELISRAAIGNQPPLYFAIIKVITQVVGLSAWSLRGLSLVAGMGLVLAAWQFTWRITKDSWCALAAALLVSIDSSCVFYSSEARPYALMQLALAWLTILVIEGSANRRTAVLRALLAALAIHLQFTAMIFLAPLYVACVVLPLFGVKRDKYQWASLGIEIGIVALLCAPLGPQVLEIAGRGKAWATFIPDPSLMGLLKMLPWAPAVVSLMAIGLDRSLSKNPSGELKSPPVLWLTWSSFAPVCLALIVSLLGIAPIFYGRYLVAALWPLLMISGLVLARYRGLSKAALAGLLVIAMIWESDLIAPSRWRDGRLIKPRNECWSLATKRVAEIDPRGELPLFVVSGLIESRQLKDNPSPLLREYCKLPVLTLYRVPHGAEKIEPASSLVPYDPPDSWIARVLEKEGGIWILRVREPGPQAWHRFGERFIRRLNERSKEKSWQLTVDTEFAGVAILQIHRRSEKSP